MLAWDISLTMVTIIKPQKILGINDFRELWRFRELMYFFVWRDLKVRYKQTAIGILWALFQPFITMVIFTVFFGKFAHLPSDGVPYPIFVFVGLLLWQFFSSALSEASNSLVDNQSIITKIYFPRLLLPISAAASKCVDFAIATLILIGLMIYYGYTPHLSGLLLLPVLLFIAFMAAVGGGFFLAAVNVKYRDVRYALPFFIQMLLFVTPVIYPVSIAGSYAWLLSINPMTGVIKAAQAAILGTGPIEWSLLGLSFLISVVILFIGIVYFKKTEAYFADII